MPMIRGSTPATAQDCLTNDRAGKIAKATAKTASGEAKKCDPSDLPLFAYTDAATVSAAGIAETAQRQKGVDVFQIGRITVKTFLAAI